MAELHNLQQAPLAPFNKPPNAKASDHISSQTDDLRTALPHLPVQPGQKLLDVATGLGHTAVFFARLGLDVTASDLSEPMLAHAAALAHSLGVTLRTASHPAENMPYPNESFDLVTCRVAAHHFSCPASFLMETTRVLKPSGRLLLIDGTVEDNQPEAEAWIHQVETLCDPTHRRFITPRRWTHLCGHVGLRVVHSSLLPIKQPDLERYFETTATPPAHRQTVRTLIQSAPPTARTLFRLNENDHGKITWWWQRLVLVAVKL